MVKQRMGSADVAAEVACLKQRLLGLRLSNLYDLHAKVWVWVGVGLRCNRVRALCAPPRAWWCAPPSA